MRDEGRKENQINNLSLWPVHLGGATDGDKEDLEEKGLEVVG